LIHKNEPPGRRALLAARLAILAVALPALTGCASGDLESPNTRVRRLRPAVAYELIRDNPEMLILDLRPVAGFLGDIGHLRSAVNLPLAELPKRLADIDPFRDDTFLLYCDSEACALQGMEILRAHGFEGAVLLDGGIEGWVRAGFKTTLPRERLGAAPRAVDAKGPLRPLRPDEKAAPAKEIDVPQGPPPP
jgi:rhodanese-related sulfurtransferase